jgi:hypothetical protein
MTTSGRIFSCACLQKHEANTLVQAVRDRLKYIFSSVYEAFVFFDNNGTNIIDRTEFRRGLCQLEVIDPLDIDPRDFVHMLMSEVDKGVRDGQIDCHEFIKHFKWHPLGDLEEILSKLRVKRRIICQNALNAVRNISEKRQGIKITSQPPKTVEDLSEVLQKIHDSEQFFFECAKRKLKKLGLNRFRFSSPTMKSMQSLSPASSPRVAGAGLIPALLPPDPALPATQPRPSARTLVPTAGVGGRVAASEGDGAAAPDAESKEESPRAGRALAIRFQMLDEGRGLSHGRKSPSENSSRRQRSPNPQGRLSNSPSESPKRSQSPDRSSRIRYSAS